MHRKEFLGVRFDCLSMGEAVAFVDSAAVSQHFRYIVTPNVDHIVRLHYARCPEMRLAYDQADLCLCDSRIVRGLARLRGIDLQTVPGSDLIAVLIPKLPAPISRITLIGGGKETLTRLARMTPAATIKHHQPPMGMLDRPDAMADAVQFIIDHPAELILLAVGSPQQEIVACRAARDGKATGVALCIGAGIEFVIGTKRRAPPILRSLGLEWLFRLMSEPRRLWRRYLLSSPRIFLMMARWRSGAPESHAAEP